jgi:hypothetical protein
MSDPYFDTAHMACPWCSYVILTGLRVALCVRCTPLVQAKDYLGPLPLLPLAESKHQCAVCQYGKQGIEKLNPLTARFCAAHVERTSHARRPPYDEPHGPRVLGGEGRGHWFF